MRYFLVTTLLMTVGVTSSALAAGCGPAVQNWQNGSQTTCTYDSNAVAEQPVVVALEAPAPPPPPPMEEEDTSMYDDSDDTPR